MTIIGVYDNHNSSVAISIDGEIRYAAQEERFTKRKNEKGFPINALNEGLKYLNLTEKDIDLVALSSTHRVDFIHFKYKTDTMFTVKDHIDMMENYWKPKLEGKPYPKHYVADVFQKKYPEGIQDFYKIPDALAEQNEEEIHKEVIRLTRSAVADILHIGEEKVKFFDHHMAHVFYGFYANPDKKNETAVITVDAMGDGQNQTVWHVKDEQFTRLEATDQCELARLYRTVTLYLGMKPLEHEYKVMGLAPYAKEKYAKEVADEFKDLLQLEGMRFVHKNRPKDLFQFVKERLKYYRFDNIAAGLQLYVEESLKELFTAVHERTGLRNFVFSGGVAMNVKANKVLADLPFVDSFFVAGSSSDESQSIGTCYIAAHEAGIENRPLSNLFLGPSIEKSDLIREVENANNYQYEIIEDIKASDIAKLLNAGEVVARISGQMEFGARSLGHRSILANPSNVDVVKEINEMIKGRDFWMPFALTVMDKFQDKYIVNPKNISSRYMAMAFETKEEVRHEIKAGTHPYDGTVRPQFLTVDQDQEFYQLLEEFSQLTGVGAVLNTSFNLHGLPMVNDESDAIHVMENSGLKYLWHESILIKKKI